jgi:hypothetical protein
VRFLLRFSRHDLLNQSLSDLIQGGFIFIVGYVLVYLRVTLMETIESGAIVSRNRYSFVKKNKENRDGMNIAM